MSLLVGLSTIAFNGLTNTTLQTTAPDRMLGRVMSIFALIFMGIMPLGQLFLGGLGSLFGIDVIPLGIVSVVLVILQGTVVGAWCFLCLVTAGISLVLVYWAYDEVWATLKYLWRVWKKTGDLKILWRVIWGGAAKEAEDVALARSAA